MKHYCLNSKVKEQIKNFTKSTKEFFLFISIFFSIGLAFAGLYILPITYLTKGITAFGYFDYFVIFLQVTWLLFGVYQLGKWFITNLEKC